VTKEEDGQISKRDFIIYRRTLHNTTVVDIRRKKTDRQGM
jgi:hypothetical protein